MKDKQITAKRAPQRTCVACRTTRPKKELVRLVRTADGMVRIDTSGKSPGRGAYMCPLWECWESGLKNKQLDHALHAALTKENRLELFAYGEDNFAT